jgi:hypothetical protein
VDKEMEDVKWRDQECNNLKLFKETEKTNNGRLDFINPQVKINK